MGKTKNQLLDEEERILKPSILAWRSFKRDKAAVVGSVMIAVILMVAVFCPLIAPYDPLEISVQNQLETPSKTNWMGRDRQGRDVLSRIMYGARTSMAICFGSVTIALLIGIPMGVIAGYYGRIVDNIIMRFVDIVFAFPVIILALAIIAVAGPSTVNVLFTIGLIYSVRIARVARGSTLSVKEKEFIEAVRSVGARDPSIMGLFILPNILAPVIVQATFFLALAIQVEAGLSFLGLGTQPPTPAWGLMLNESRRFMEYAPWMALFPGLAIIFAVVAFNMMGDGLRNALDPHLSQR